MRIRSCWALTTMLVLLSIGSAAAQQTARGTITGRITDKETQAGIAGATVEAVSGGRTAASAVTDADGQYRLALPAGTYSIVVNMVGFQTERVASVRVLAGETSINALALTTQAFVLNPVVVSASKHVEKLVDAPAAISVVPEREIAERPTTTPVEHLRNTPGVDIMTTGVQGTNVVVRGFNNIFSGALHTLTDYRIAGVPSLRVNFLQFIPQNNDDFSRMEVVMGPGSALYGPNTANGVLHIITKSPLDDQGTTLSGSFGSYGGATPTAGLTPAPVGTVLACTSATGVTATKCPSGSMFAGTFRTAQKLSDRFGFKVSAQVQNADEFFYRDRGEDSVAAIVKAGLAANSAPALRATGLFPTTSTDADVIARAGRIANRDFDTKRWAGDVRADWRAADAFSMVFSGGMTNDNSIELTGIGAAQAVDWKYQYAQARANYRSWFAQTYINKSDAGETYLLRNGAPIHDQSQVWVSQLQNVSRLGVRQTFTYGADYISTNPITNGTINGAREDDDKYTEFGAYLQSESKLSKMFDLVLAGRGDKHSRLEDWVFSPRAAIVFKPNENHNFRATFNKAFSTPTSLNLFLDIDAGALGALGPFGFRAHAQAPGREGISLHAADGSIQIRTPFSSSATAVSPAQYFGDPTALQAVSLASIFERQISALGLANAGVGGNAALIGYMRSLPTTDAAAFAAANPSVATVSGDGVISGVAAGSTTVTASAGGMSGTAQVNVTAGSGGGGTGGGGTGGGGGGTGGGGGGTGGGGSGNIASISVTPTSVQLTPGASAQLNATVRDGSGNTMTGVTVTFASDNNTVATVDASGKVTGAAPGSATITASAGGFNANVSVTVSGNPTVGSITISPSSPQVCAGNSTQLTATVRDNLGNIINGLAVTFSSNNNAVATVSSSGLLTGVAAGTAVITANAGGKSADVTANICLNAAASVDIVPASANLNVGSSLQLQTAVRDAAGALLSGKIVNFASNNTAVATVTAGGLVVGLTPGTATITATVEGKTGTMTVTVH